MGIWSTMMTSHRSASRMVDLLDAEYMISHIPSRSASNWGQIGNAAQAHLEYTQCGDADVGLEPVTPEHLQSPTRHVPSASSTLTLPWLQ